MKKLILVLLLGLIVGLGTYLYITRPCYAGLCYQGKCMSSSFCGSGCFCGKDWPEPMGFCYSIDRADELLQQGIQILP